ncbi:MAG: ABC transporter ATP-binding protein [Spirochaetales bacterium]|nr:ABC transporter ATP-binding protein [Spirochaetales bacterium]
MIEFKNLTKSYKKDVYAVKDLSFVIPDGSVFGFLGPNGAGKSTTIKMLCTILNANSGSVLFNGQDINSNLMEYKSQIAYVPDEPTFYQKITGYKYLNFIADIFKVGSVERKERIEKYAKLFDLTNALNDQISSYSHGMGQKLSLIAALIHEPKLLILDEPMVGLDPKASRIVKDLMREEASKGNTVFFSTHVLEVAQSICDYVAIIDKGKLVRTDKTENLVKDESLEDFFLSITEDKNA